MAWSLTQSKHNVGWSESGFYLTWENHWSVTEQTPDSDHPGYIKLQVVLKTDYYSCSDNNYYCRANDTVSYNGTTVNINSASWSALQGSKPSYTKNIYVPISWSGKTVTFYIGWTTKTVTLGAVGDFRSTINASNGTITVAGGNIPITLTTKVSGVKHTLKVKVGNSAAVTLLSNSAATSVTWRPTASDWAQYITGSNSGTATITCTTYFGSASMESQAKTITVSLVASEVAPVIASQYVDSWVTVTYDNPAAAATGSPSASEISAFVQGYSKAKATFTSNQVEYQYGATLSKYRITCNGVDYDSTSTSNTVIILTDILSNTSASVVCTVFDSRGNSASKTIQISLNAYSNPVITDQVVYRCTQNGTQNDEGTYISVSATANISSISDINTYTIAVFTKTVNSSVYTLQQSGTSTSSMPWVLSENIQDPFSPDTTYDIKIELTDKVGNVAVYTTRLSTRTWVMKFRGNGLGVGFGKAPEVDNAIEVPDTWKIRFGDNIFHPSILGAAENGNTAANNHFNGDYFVWNGNLVRASSNISAGDPISALVTTTDVASALNTYGTEGIWKYRKYNDGTYHAWYEGDIGLAQGVAWGSGFYHHASTLDLTPPSFSTSVTSMGGSANSAILLLFAGHNQSDYKTYWANANSATYASVPVRIDMYGTWHTIDLPADANANPS